MRAGRSGRPRIAALGWLATVATSLSFLPALADKSFVVQGALISGLVVGVGAVLRAVRTPSLVVALLQVIVLVEVLLLRFGTELKAGFLPTPTALSGIEALLRSGADVAQSYAAPAPANDGLLLMVLFAIGLVSLLVDVLAGSLGRVPLAGLPLLALYTVPVAVLPTGVPFYEFVPGAATYIAMVMADERDRLSSWGRLVTRSADRPQTDRIDTSGLHATGRRVSLLALSAAVVLPVFLPALSSSILDAGRGTQPGGGSGGTLSFSDPMVSLASSLRRTEAVDLLKVSSSVTPEYLRLVVLDTPGANAWTAQNLDLTQSVSLATTLPSLAGLSAAVETRPEAMSVTLTSNFPDDSAWLPVPYNAQFVGTTASFSYLPEDQTVAARTESAIEDVAPYQVEYSTIAPTADQLKNAGPAPEEITRRFGTVPSDVPAVVGNTAQSVTAGAESPYDQALLLQSYFREPGQFFYDLDVGYGYGFESMAKFLDERRGFCQQFAATMAVMARELGIPSRVAVGFLQPDRIEDDDTYVFTSHNVHSWPELYFDGVGWVRFEPTPGLNAPLPAYAPRTVAPTNAPTASTEPLATDTPTSLRDPGNTAAAPTTPAAGSSGTSAGSGVLPSRGWLISLAVIGLMLLPAALRYGVRRARMTRPLDAATAAESAWLEVRDHVLDLRLPWAGSMTPRARESAVAPLLHEDPEGLAALHRLAMAVERARYSTSVAPDVEPADDARVAMSAISRHADRGQRVRALFWPSSLMPDLQRGWARLRTRLGSRSDASAPSSVA